MKGQALLTGGADFSDMEVFKEFYLGQQRRLAMAGKILFPIPNRRVSKRLYRVTAPTLVLWGGADRLIVPAYAERWAALIPGATGGDRPGRRAHAAVRAAGRPSSPPSPASSDERAARATAGSAGRSSGARTTGS